MKECQGSFTIEAAFITPLLLFCICLAIELGISLHNEVKILALSQMDHKPLDLVSAMYRRELVEELLGELYEN